MTKRERTCVPQGRGLDLYYSPNPLECGGGESQIGDVSRIFIKSLFSFRATHQKQTDLAREKNRVDQVGSLCFCTTSTVKGSPSGLSFFVLPPHLVYPERGFFCTTDGLVAPTSILCRIDCRFFLIGDLALSVGVATHPPLV